MKQALHRLLTAIEKSKQLPRTCRGAIISLLYKNKGSREELGNWRPISLLNCDYKILAKVWATRLMKVTNRVLHPDQTCSVPGRSIQDANFTLYNMLEYERSDEESECDFTSVDQYSAFDVPSHKYARQVLVVMGFGERFINFFDAVYRKGFIWS